MCVFVHLSRLVKLGKTKQDQGAEMLALISIMFITFTQQNFSTKVYKK